MTFKGADDKDTTDKSTTTKNPSDDASKQPTKNDPAADAPKNTKKDDDDKPKSSSSSKITDATTGEELAVFHGKLSDGREFVVNARDEESARAVAREQGGGVPVFEVKKGKPPKKDES